MRINRKSSGSMLALVVLFLGILVAMGLGGIVFNSFLYECAQSQYKVDALAMSLAAKINAGDRVGQMNELVERSRELVFVSRERCNECGAGGEPHLDALCDQLLAEAYQGQRLVEQERDNQVKVISKELQQLALDHNAGSASASAFRLPWLSACEPKVVRVAVGRMKDIESNVRTLEVLDELAAFDRSHGYVEQSSKLYRANVNARLPDPFDAHLDFRFASLPARVKGTCSPARNANPEVFVPSATIISGGAPVRSSLKDIPSAVQVSCATDVSIGEAAVNNLPVTLSSTGATCGAFSEPD